MENPGPSEQPAAKRYRGRRRATPMSVDEMVDMVEVLQRRDYDCSKHQYARPNLRKDRIMQEVVEVLRGKFGQERSKDQLRKRWSDLKSREHDQMEHIQKVLRRRHKRSGHKRRHHHHRHHHRHHRQHDQERSGDSPRTSACDAPQADQPQEDIVPISPENPQHTPTRSPTPLPEPIRISSPHSPAAQSPPAQRSPLPIPQVDSDLDEATGSPSLGMTASTRGLLVNQITLVQLHYERASQSLQEAEQELQAGKKRLRDVVDILSRF